MVTLNEGIFLGIDIFLLGLFFGCLIMYFYFMNQIDEVEANNKILRDDYREDLKDLRDKLKKYERTNV